MAEENQTSNAPAAEVTQEKSAEGERAYSQAEVDQLLKAAKDSAFADARRTLKPKRQDEPKQTKSNSDEKGGDSDRLVRILAQRDALDDVLSTRTVTKEQRAKLRAAVELANPDEPTAWLESFVEGLFPVNGESKTETKTTNAQKETPVAQRQPGDHPGPPQGAPPWERPTDPFKWTEEDVARLEAVKGKREAHRLIRQKAEQFARSMRIQAAPTRR